MSDTKTAAYRYTRAKELRLQGQTFTQIGAELGVTRQRAHMLVNGSPMVRETRGWTLGKKRIGEKKRTIRTDLTSPAATHKPAPDNAQQK